MSWTSIFVHMIFSTGNRTPFLKTPDLRREVFTHIKENARKKDIWLDSVNGYDDHAHCLIKLDKDQSISQAAQLIKGESSYWINKTKLTKGHFNWQDDYWAVSVGNDDLGTLRKYIFSQEEHHRKYKFEEELRELLEMYQDVLG